jgi:two-component system sensor histidine kinase KdpD
LKRLAGTTGLEPATSDVTGRRSNQLNYVPLLSENVGHPQNTIASRPAPPAAGASRDNVVVAILSEKKPAPEQLLRQLESDEEYQSTSRLKIFLGYASGVGKSFRMLDEGRRRHERGQDVVVGAIQPDLPGDLAQTVSTLEIIPLKEVDGIAVMDLPALLKRRPKVCLVDGLAYDNPPSSVHAKRWQDVEQLLKAGISVITSVNLQHIEEKRERVEAITAKHVSETVPLSFLQTADEIVVVDAPAQTCLDSDGGARAQTKLNQHQLSELREIALLLAADVVDKQLERYMASHGIEQLWGTQERIAVWLSPGADAARMLASGARNRDRFHGELVTVHLDRPEWSAEQRQQVRDGVTAARATGAEVVELAGEDAVETILRFARQRGITQIYVGRRGRDSWRERCFGSDLDRLIRAAEGIDVRVFPHN